MENKPMRRFRESSPLLGGLDEIKFTEEEAKPFKALARKALWMVILVYGIYFAFLAGLLVLGAALVKYLFFA